jgi:hypothetical protein
VGGPDIRISNGLWVKGHADGTFELGSFGSRLALVELAARYRLDALSVRTIAIPGSSGEEGLELMMMTFDRNGLARAATLARGASNPDIGPRAAALAASPAARQAGQ